MSYRSLALTTLLAVSPVFAQDPSGVLVTAPPRAVQQSLGWTLRAKAGAAVPQIIRVQPPRACAIRLTEIPVKEGIDDGIFLKDSGHPIDNAMIVEPAAPPCPLPGK